MADKKVQVLFQARRTERDYIKAQAKAQGISQGAFILRTIELWKHIEAGKVRIHLPPEPPPDYSDRLAQIRADGDPPPAEDL